MTDIHQIFDSLIGYLVGMTLVEVIVKPILVRLGKSALKEIDERVNDVVPDFLHENE